MTLHLEKIKSNNFVTECNNQTYTLYHTIVHDMFRQLINSRKARYWLADLLLYTSIVFVIYCLTPTTMQWKDQFAIMGVSIFLACIFFGTTFSPLSAFASKPKDVTSLDFILNGWENKPCYGSTSISRWIYWWIKAKKQAHQKLEECIAYKQLEDFVDRPDIQLASQQYTDAYQNYVSVYDKLNDLIVVTKSQMQQIQSVTSHHDVYMRLYKGLQNQLHNLYHKLHVVQQAMSSVQLSMDELRDKYQDIFIMGKYASIAEQYSNTDINMLEVDHDIQAFTDSAKECQLLLNNIAHSLSDTTTNTAIEAEELFNIAETVGTI